MVYFQVKNKMFGVFGHRDASIKIFKNDAKYSDFHSDIIYINKSTQKKEHCFHNLFRDHSTENEC